MNQLHNTESAITAVGITIPVDWDVKGHPLAFALFTYDEQEYLIDGVNGLGRKLIRMPHKKIRVQGHLKDIVNNRQVITVTGFEQI